jgi:hypothetical protein
MLTGGRGTAHRLVCCLPMAIVEVTVPLVRQKAAQHGVVCLRLSTATGLEPTTPRTTTERSGQQGRCLQTLLHVRAFEAAHVHGV